MQPSEGQHSRTNASLLLGRRVSQCWRVPEVQRDSLCKLFHFAQDPTSFFARLSPVLFSPESQGRKAFAWSRGNLEGTTLADPQTNTHLGKSVHSRLWHSQALPPGWGNLHFYKLRGDSYLA